MKNNLIALIFISLLCSCDKELDVKPDSQITAASFWTTQEDVTGARSGMYARFRTFTDFNLYYLGESRSEIMGTGILNADFRIPYFQNRLNKITAPGPDWGTIYTVIHDINLILKYAPGIKFTSESTKNTILAEAYTMRAFLYFVLVRTWGGTPLLLDPTESFDPATIYKPRASEDEMFKLITDDLAKALELFPVNTYPTRRGAWSKPAANALKGDVYLWIAKRRNGGESALNTALAALQEVQKTDVGLLPNFADVFSYANKGNKEIVFAVRYQDLEAVNNYSGDMYIRDSDLPPGTDAETLKKIGLGGGMNWWAPSETMRKQFTADDKRKDKSFVEIYGKNAQGNPTFYTSIMTKFSGFIDANGRRFLDDIIIYRYADILLMIAEAKNALGQDPSAEINLVRQRAYGDQFEKHKFVSSSKTVNDDEILRERLFELAFEGKRWWDLVRFNKAFDLVPSLADRKGQTNLLLFPLSETVMSRNSKLVQNPGYE
ncbi:RagB/SusD family nutrient uptake outer membrane protein [Larkinella rosea]|uniref:RagB/SusD family nutrient uptake outer membrane protein n=1 Tax=Larkinella rosea TaxID=2025312 RepID=A0A3P1C2G4_9BACT|nr:RagB/SusD family nutrient uptake outer membrane protein [Larkinella rosea]RRB07472.1 RagB/SusD family nutrient uptake outer membrane protein [Larkinella rosea]